MAITGIKNSILTTISNMRPKNSPDSLWHRISRVNEILLMDRRTMLPRKRFKISWLTIIIILSAVMLVCLVGGALLSTHTPLLKYMGARPRNILTQDYTRIKTRLDSLESMSAIRDKQLVQIEQFITRSGRVADSERSTTETAEDQKPETNLKRFAIPPYCCLSWPLEGERTGAFKPELNHMGVDIAGKLNSKVHTISDGYVIFSGYDKLYGNSVIIVHPNGIESHYLHNSRLLVNTGQYVSKGQPIAIIGNTGEFSNGPHLHFELWIGGVEVDPEKYLNIRHQ